MSLIQFNCPICWWNRVLSCFATNCFNFLGSILAQSYWKQNFGTIQLVYPNGEIFMMFDVQSEADKGLQIFSYTFQSILKYLDDLFIISVGSLQITSTRHIAIPISCMSLFQINIPWSAEHIILLNLGSSSLALKYQYLHASTRPYTHLLKSRMLFVLASFGSCK